MDTLNVLKLKSRMVELGITQEILANKIGMTRSTLANQLTGKRDMSLDTACKIQEVLNIPDQDFKYYFFSEASRTNAK